MRLDTLSPDTRTTIPTGKVFCLFCVISDLIWRCVHQVTDNLFTQGVISSNLVAVSFEPATSEQSTNGEVTFGGTDSSKFTGSISFTLVLILVAVELLLTSFS